ncbi:ExeM/NucH family extracellular endonuclease [Microbacterium sp. JB110]|uniref:ExeM/NucH family extracellular endonuclease n=1 Tax=Microbacterium sp. JB110 TaxID=2024477 RepID=UPI00097EB904|nr:ExeM/NucH family extracellular endonuclease [Microbacterium sp. JB110]SJM67999.1 5'-nucleotidase [Frigoribacterium sp. JB110]
MSTTPHGRRIAAAASGLALAASALVLVPSAATASPEGDALIISEVYGGGGNSGAPVTHDFVELYNPTGADIDLGGYAVEYRSSSGGSGGIAVLEGTIESDTHFLLQLAAGSNGDVTPLPTPDAEASINMSGSNGRVFLFESDSDFDSSVAGDRAGAAGLVDMVGYGSAASFEGAATDPLSNSTSASRDAAGTDTDDNSADFTVGDPTPTNSAGETAGDGSSEDPDEPQEPVEHGDAVSIAEANGAVGETVTVDGVVTADYRDGGFNGFTIQDPAGDPNDGVSDAIFVWGDSARAEIGQSVRVTGDVSVYNGLTEITADLVTTFEVGLGEVAPITSWEVIATDEDKQAHQSELVQIDGFTVTDNYDANFYGSFGLAYGDEPLRQPTDHVDPHDEAAIAAAEAENAAKFIKLDDGRSTNFSNQQDVPLSYLTPETPVRVGASVTMNEPFVLDYRYDSWNFQPTTPVNGDASDIVTFSDERAANAAPAEVGGDLSLATFNVLNYFPTTGEEFEAAGLGTCSFYTDREGNPVANNRCNPDGPRGAADEENLDRQQTKIVNAIIDLDASVVSLEEIENSAHYDKDRDFAVETLVGALNEQAGADTWGFAASPEELPTDEDVIRNAFIYQTAEVETVGESHILVDDPAFGNAREPLVQAFAPVGADDADAFMVATNHLKSKGSGTDDGTGQGNANPDRIAQAEALVDFAAEQGQDAGIDAVFLAGDFNAYAAEDPAVVIEEAGYTNLNYALNGGEATYNYDGLDGSLDHVFANSAALDLVTGVDVWQINAQEQVGFEYSRYNYNATLLYDESIFRASDHNPILVGLQTQEAEEPTDPEEPGTEEPTDPEEPGTEEPTDPEEPGTEEPTDPDEPGTDGSGTDEPGTDGSDQDGAGTDAPVTDDAQAGDDEALAVTGGEVAWGVGAAAALLIIGGITLSILRRQQA